MKGASLKHPKSNLNQIYCGRSIRKYILFRLIKFLCGPPPVQPKKHKDYPIPSPVFCQNHQFIQCPPILITVGAGNLQNSLTIFQARRPGNLPSFSNLEKLPKKGLGKAKCMHIIIPTEDAS